MIKQSGCSPVQTSEIAADLGRPREEPGHRLPFVWQFDPIPIGARKYGVAKVLRWSVGQDDGSLVSGKRVKHVENGELRHAGQHSNDRVPDLDISVAPLGTSAKQKDLGVRLNQVCCSLLHHRRRNADGAELLA
ncbi:hypothetical protein A5764_17085 [Mycobacterium sp. 852002-51057_SCH5723018]|nr:hypothetical protein A5764_17085 [Mycobacterium sp. 852002-51057_SCH5723018]